MISKSNYQVRELPEAITLWNAPIQIEASIRLLPANLYLQLRAPACRWIKGKFAGSIYRIYYPFDFRPYSPLDTTSCPPSSSSSPGNTGSLHVTPTLLESQIAKLAAAAERLSKHLPQFEPKPHNAKKKMCKELEVSIKKIYILINIAIISGAIY